MITIQALEIYCFGVVCGSAATVVTALTWAMRSFGRLGK
ncbi:hypothetical protein GC1_00034 [Gluconobacter phage GC1]|uniref:Uncharacterized protein n=1 Tax=Gluconobacter phage GC1 TaxID=2047788 RepID=A0A2I5AR95_9VIRU|nr:hypothetical protein FDJ08_gp34 [Gluconobacter phage GC1]ATS92602.1 hypothetical protein GC1_00034 [Gluconobacter phage GC1]